MDSWYLVDDSSGTPVTTGPFTLEQLQAKVAEGRLRPDSLVAPVGSSDWIAAASDPRLSGLFGPASWSAPPRVPPVAAVAATPPEYSFTAAFELGWRSFTKRWSSWLLLSLAIMGLSIVVQIPQQGFAMVGQMMVAQGNDEGMTLIFGGVCIGLILQMLVGLPLLNGLVYAGARIHRGEGRLSDMFEGFRQYGTAVASGALLMLVYLGCGIVAYAPALVVAFATASPGGAAGRAGWVFAVFVLAIAIALVLMATVVMRFLFAPVIAIDPAFGRPGVVEAFRMSWRQTGSRGLSMMLLMFVAGVIAALTILLFCVGYLLIGIPLLLAIVSAMFHLLYRPERSVSMDAP